MITIHEHDRYYEPPAAPEPPEELEGECTYTVRFDTTGRIERTNKHHLIDQADQLRILAEIKDQVGEVKLERIEWKATTIEASFRASYDLTQEWDGHGDGAHEVEDWQRGKAEALEDALGEWFELEWQDFRIRLQHYQAEQD